MPERCCGPCRLAVTLHHPHDTQACTAETLSSSACVPGQHDGQQRAPRPAAGAGLAIVRDGQRAGSAQVGWWSPPACMWQHMRLINELPCARRESSNHSGLHAVWLARGFASCTPGVCRVQCSCCRQASLKNPHAGLLPTLLSRRPAAHRATHAFPLAHHDTSRQGRCC